MIKGFDPQIANPIITGFVEELMTAKGGLAASQPFEIAAKPINEYEGRMRLNVTERFDGGVFLAAVSFYLTQAELQTHRPRGALVLYLDIEVADKILKAAGLQVPYDEDDESMMKMGGMLCQMIADAFKDRLSSAGFAAMVVSPPCVYKNSIPEGVEFSKDQHEKQELSFYFLKHKAMAVDWTMAPLPKK
jgi:hypothetical protein